MTDKLREVSTQGLAHIGDAVFELMVRTYLCEEGTWSASKLHGRAVSYVSAKAQAVAAEVLLPVLNEDEAAVYKRGRNSHTGSVPKSTTNEQYNAATGLEALFGYLYLAGDIERLNELFILVISKE